MNETVAFELNQLVRVIAWVIDVVGVLVILVGLGLATFKFASRTKAPDAYHQLRLNLAKGILLGLEFLIAADIIRTVTVAPTLEGVSVLGMIVLVRTFLSMALQVELEGRWPWQRASTPAMGPGHAKI